MPSFTPITFDRLLEPTSVREKPVTEQTRVNVRLENRDGSVDGNLIKKAVQKKHHWTQISPALYTTPVATPVPDTTDEDSSFSYSPYIINHKRRGASLAKRSSNEALNGVIQVQITHVDSVEEKTDVFAVEKDAILSDGDAHIVLNRNAEIFVEKTEDAGVANEVVDQISPRGVMIPSTAKDGESDNFFDPRDTLSCSSFSDVEYSPSFESSMKFASSAGEFYDAPEELSSDSGTSISWNSPARDIESELRGMKLALSEEIEHRKQVEIALQNMQRRWLKLREQLSSAGIVLPEDFPLHPETENGNSLDVCDQINMARMVSEAIGRGIAKAEAEKEMEEQLELKNFEISRLNDRLNYYEAVNHEMSQRNQEGMESARRLRQQKTRRQRWVWGSMATAITLGVAALAWTYLPTDKGLFSSNNQEIPTESDNSGN